MFDKRGLGIAGFPRGGKFKSWPFFTPCRSSLSLLPLLTLVALLEVYPSSTFLGDIHYSDYDTHHSLWASTVLQLNILLI